MNDYLFPSIFDNATINLIKADAPQPFSLLTGAMAYKTLEPAIRKNGVGLANASWNVSSTVLGITTGHLIWNEKINQKKFIGVLLGIAALYLMNGEE